jgi:hypothetical protein
VQPESKLIYPISMETVRAEKACQNSQLEVMRQFISQQQRAFSDAEIKIFMQQLRVDQFTTFESMMSDLLSCSSMYTNMLSGQAALKKLLDE